MSKLIYDLPYADYEQLQGIRISTLRWAEKSAKHLQAALDGKLSPEDTPDKRLGRAIHVKLLEPTQFFLRFPTAGPCEAELKSGENKGAACGKQGSRTDGLGGWFCGLHGKGMSEPEDYVTASESADLDTLVEAVKGHPAVKLLRKHGGSEVSWQTEIDGVRMKGRIDKLIHESADWPASVVDLKKVQVGACTVEKCRAAVANYGYHAQAAAYRLALQQIEGVDANCYLVFLEDGPPHDVLVMELSPADLDVGTSDLHRWLHVFKTGNRTGVWPGRYNDIEIGALPEWATRQYSGAYA